MCFLFILEFGVHWEFIKQLICSYMNIYLHIRVNASLHLFTFNIDSTKLNSIKSFSQIMSPFQNLE